MGVVISSLRLDDATWKANFESLSTPSSSSDRRTGGWDSLRRVILRDPWNVTHVNDNSGRITRSLLDSIRGRPTEIKHASGGDDGTLLSTRSSSIYPDALPLFQITYFCRSPLRYDVPYMTK